MDIANNDIMFSNVQQYTQKMDDMVINKVKELKRSQEENQFLNMVYKDYLNHYDHILNEKYKTRNALFNIYKHLENIERTNDFTNNKLLQAKKEQNSVLNKLYHVKSEIDSITNLD